MLTQFYINFWRQEHQIDVMSQSTPELLRFQPIPPFIFPLQSLKYQLINIWDRIRWNYIDPRFTVFKSYPT